MRNEKDFWSGVMFIIFGLFFALAAQNYDMGTSQRMGPAYFPTLLGGILALLGAVIAIIGFGRESADGKVERFHFAEAAWVLGAVVVFAVLLLPAGVLVAMVALVVISSAASHEFRWTEAIVLSLAMALITYVTFVVGLKLTIPVLPAFLGK
jgi:peptidoglycan/LPS O-acetylase OafA/YrhL